MRKGRLGGEGPGELVLTAWRIGHRDGVPEGRECPARPGEGRPDGSAHLEVVDWTVCISICLGGPYRRNHC